MRDLLQGLLGNPTRVGWESWAVALNEAIADEDRWMQGVLSLSLEHQYGLLELLKTTGGVYADALLLITARHANDIGDEQLREWVLADAGESSSRLGDRLQQQRDVLLTLTNRPVGEGNSAVDIAAEVARLQARLHELNTAAVGAEYEEAWHLEGDVIRLEALARILGSYDADARRAERDALKTTTDAVASVRDRLEDELAEQMSVRDKAEAERHSLERELAHITAGRDRLLAANDQLRTDIAALTAERDSLSREQATKAAEVAKLEKDVAEKRQRVATEAGRLDELRSSPSAQADDRVLAKVSELYALLPADRAEASFKEPPVERN